MLSIPYTALKFLLKPLKSLYRDVKEGWKLRKIRQDTGSSSNKNSKDDSSGSKETKEVVLDKVRKDED